MAFTCDSPMAYKIPEARQRLASRDAVFHALSVGFGQHPIDLRRFDFVARERFRLLHALVRTRIFKDVEA
jgi:hypothetical protein